MASFFLFIITFFLFPASLTSGVEVREMSIDEYINFVNPQPVHKYQDEFGENILCVKFSDHISVKYAHDNITRGLKKIPKLTPWTRNISGFDSGGANLSKLGIKAECPEGTVMVREIKREDLERAGSVAQFLDRGRRNHLVLPNADYDDPTDPRANYARQHAVAYFTSYSRLITRISANLNIWRPELPPDGHFSLSQIWLNAYNGDRLETLEAGWTVQPNNYHDYDPHFFIFWTSNTYQNGCYDTMCPGFVPIQGATSPGSRLHPASEYEGNQYSIQIAIELQGRGDVGLIWALHLDDEFIGYWPASLFVTLARGAREFNVGGEVTYLRRPPGTRLSTTHMGSGHFPDEGFRRAAYTNAIQIFGSNGIQLSPLPRTLATKPECYKIEYTPDDGSAWGKHVFFGRPGGFNNPDCVE